MEEEFLINSVIGDDGFDDEEWSDDEKFDEDIDNDSDE